jgi:ABC-type transporter Mla subunit MlaD
LSGVDELDDIIDFLDRQADELDALASDVGDLMEVARGKAEAIEDKVRHAVQTVRYVDDQLSRLKPDPDDEG